MGGRWEVVQWGGGKSEEDTPGVGPHVVACGKLSMGRWFEVKNDNDKEVSRAKDNRRVKSATRPKT